MFRIGWRFGWIPSLRGLLAIAFAATPRALETDVLTKKLIEQGVFLG